MTALGSFVYIYGGQEPSTGLCFGDVVQLDTKTWHWHPLRAAGGHPPPRHAHCAGALGAHSILVYGGASQQDECAPTLCRLCRRDTPRLPETEVPLAAARAVQLFEGMMGATDRVFRA